jgi:hypothetical protein
MKAYLITILLSIEFVVNILAAQPPVVIKALKQKFPSATSINWVKKEDNNWEATFLLGGRKTSAVFTSDGHWLTAVQEIKLEELGNDNVRMAIKRDFPNCEVLHIGLYTSLSYGTWYSVVVKCGKSMDVKFYDSNGWDWPPKMTLICTAHNMRYV